MFLVLLKPESAFHFLSACSHPTASGIQVVIFTTPVYGPHSLLIEKIQRSYVCRRWLILQMKGFDKFT